MVVDLTTKLKVLMQWKPLIWWKP